MSGSSRELREALARAELRAAAARAGIAACKEAQAPLPSREYLEGAEARGSRRIFLAWAVGLGSALSIVLGFTPRPPTPEPRVDVTRLEGDVAREEKNAAAPPDPSILASEKRIAALRRDALYPALDGEEPSEEGAYPNLDVSAHPPEVCARWASVAIAACTVGDETLARHAQAVLRWMATPTDVDGTPYGRSWPALAPLTAGAKSLQLSVWQWCNERLDL